MEVVDLGVRRRAMTATGTVEKKRKRLNEEEDDEAEFEVNSSTTSTTSYIQLRSRRILVDHRGKGNRCSRTKSDHRDDDISCCSSSMGSSEKRILELPDLEDEIIEVQSSTNFRNEESSMNSSRRETTPLSKLRAEPEDLDSTPRPSEANSHHRSTAEKMPTEAELEEFFTAAEKNLQKQFAEKYNYDIFKDEPLEGHHEWVRLKP